jgi:hypothetical protein
VRLRYFAYLAGKPGKRYFVSLVLLFVVAIPTIGGSELDPASEEKLVQQLVAAFNDRDIPAMLEQLEEDVQ